MIRVYLRRIFWLYVSIFICWAGSAIAQSEAVAGPLDTVPPTSALHDVWVYVQPIAAMLVTVLVPALLTMGLSLLWKGLQRIGVSLDDDTRKRIHEAAENALKSAIAKNVGPMPNMIEGPVSTTLVKTAIDYMKEMNPNDTKKFSDGQLADVILSKVPQVQAVVAAGTGVGVAPTVEVAKAAEPKT